MDAILYYAGSVLLVIFFVLWIYSRHHVKYHLFVAHCPMCKRDPYRMAIAAEQLGLVPEGALLETLDEDDRHD